ncbi:MAG: YicC family protein [Gammaproteobacteria bacterium]|nr:MAG: YicC family protein [Gammaproteobacteria bacterium]
MIRSMTAFASRELEVAGFFLSWEVRSVNHRYLEPAIRLPENFRFVEPEVRVSIGKWLKRGKVDCTLVCKREEGEEGAVIVNTVLAKQLVGAMSELEGLMNEPSAVSPLELMRWPGILQAPEVDREKLAESVAALLNETLEELVEAREREGERLRQLIVDRCDSISRQVELAKERLPNVMVLLREKMNKRIAEMVAEPDQDRLEQEMAMLSQKYDVDEELDRLCSHIEEVLRTLDQKGAIGRRLDFLMQELNREANTLGSKSTDTNMTRISVEMKVLIEQMREQIQNIE